MEDFEDQGALGSKVQKRVSESNSVKHSVYNKTETSPALVSDWTKGGVTAPSEIEISTDSARSCFVIIQTP